MADYLNASSGTGVLLCDLPRNHVKTKRFFSMEFARILEQRYDVANIFDGSIVMVVQDGAVSVWFGRGRQNDAKLLQIWRSAPLTFSPEQDIDENWCVDRYEVILGNDPTGALFQRAARLTLSNRFYPAEVMAAVSDYSLAQRAVQPGDRVLQRIRIIQYRGMPVLEVLTMNEITQVIEEPRRAGFTYTTTTAHAEIGEWSPTVEWRENGEVALVISVVSRSRPGASAFSRRFSRRMQLRAHKVSIQNFLAQLSGVPYLPPASRPSTSAGMLPAALLATASILFLYVILGFSRKD
jgi:uncharacterized protein (UPF0548 family)